MLRRREFLGVGAAGLSYVSLAGEMPGLFARAAEAANRADANDHALVVVELGGGNDGLNTVIPFEDALYYRNRGTLSIPKKDVIRLSDQVGLHPRMNALGKLFREGQVVVVQGVGYPEPDRSHFRSMEIWHTASTEPTAPPFGWLGRYLDALEPTPAEVFPRGLALTPALPQALQAQRATVPVVARLDGVGEASEAQSALCASSIPTALGRLLARRRFSGGRPIRFSGRRTASRLPPQRPSRRPLSSIRMVTSAVSSTEPRRSSGLVWACGSCSFPTAVSTPTRTRPRRTASCSRFSPSRSTTSSATWRRGSSPRR